MKNIIVFLLFVTVSSFAQNNSKDLKEEFIEFIKEDELIVEFTSGDFNGDKFTDAVLVTANKNERKLVNSAGEKYKRNLIILQRNRATGKLEKILENNDVVYCFNCGAEKTSPLTSISLKSNLLTIEHSGGKMNRWSRVTTFEYNRDMQLWWLIKDASSTYNLSKRNTIKSLVKTQDDFGFIYFQYFDAFSEDLTKQIKN